jgi:16S rRNA C967 or C1407 C5-methylase (RsmB/RsmF family)
MQEFSQEFTDKMKKLLGEETSKFFASLDNPIQKAITINPTRLNGNNLEDLIDFSISPIPEIENGYFVDDNIKIGKHILHHLGIVYSQEPSAMYPVEMLDIRKGDIVLDLCASPGGKSIQILEKLLSGKAFL